MAKKIVLAGACRTAIGTMGGSLSTTPAPVLGSIVIKEALNRAGVPADQVDHVSRQVLDRMLHVRHQSKLVFQLRQLLLQLTLSVVQV